jgi:hypothetical protein
MMFYSDPARESCPHALPDAEVFYINYSGDLEGEEPGWYYWFCFPGCIPDSEPTGPFQTQEEAIEDCRQNYAE